MNFKTKVNIFIITSFFSIITLRYIGNSYDKNITDVDVVHTPPVEYTDSSSSSESDEEDGEGEDVEGEEVIQTPIVTEPEATNDSDEDFAPFYI